MRARKPKGITTIQTERKTRILAKQTPPNVTTIRMWLTTRITRRRRTLAKNNGLVREREKGGEKGRKRKKKAEQ